MSGFLTCPHGHGDFVGDQCPECAPREQIESDPEAFDNLAPELDALVNSWLTRGVSVRVAWSILTAAILTIADANDCTLEGVQEVISGMWNHANSVRDQAEADPGGDQGGN